MTGVSEGYVPVYLILWQTFFPAGSSVCEEDNEQQSRALRALRSSVISTQGPTLKPGTKFPIRLTSFFLSSQLVLLPVRGSTMRGSISLSADPPPFPLSFSPVSRLVARLQPERSKPPGFLFPFPEEVRATSFYSARHRAF